MSDERREAQATLYAIGALPPEEVYEFEMALRGDLKLQLLLAELAAAADAIAAALPPQPPPPRLKEKIMAAVDQDLAATSGTGPDLLSGENLSGQVWVGWAVAAAFAVLCLLLLWLGHSFRRQNAALAQELEQLKGQSAQIQTERDNLQEQVEQLSANYGELSSNFQQRVAQRSAEFQRQKADLQKQVEQRSSESQREVTALQRQVFRAVAEKDRLRQELIDVRASFNKDPFAEMRLLTLKPAADAPPQAAAGLIWDRKRRQAMLVVEALPLLPAGRTYQLWMFETNSSGSAINAGIFNVDEHGTARVQFAQLPNRVEEIGRLLITSEGKGGGAAPGKIILSSH